MSIKQQLTIDDLKRILREAAGEGEAIDLSGDISDVPFSELGYDSIALLETTGRIEREFGTSFPENTVATAETPRAMLDLVNENLLKAHQT